MYQLVRGKPIEQYNFTIVKAKTGSERYERVCENIFLFDTETTSDFIDEFGNVFIFDYDNPKKAQDSIKHSVCYLWQFGIDDETRYIGRELSDFVLLLKKLQRYCPYIKSCFIHNLSFDFCFLQNVIQFSDVFARKPRHPMRAKAKDYNMIFKCSYVLMNLSLESWAKALKLPVQKHVGQLDYKKLRTPLTPLTADEIDYSLADLDVMYYGLDKLRKQYGALYKIPMTHTGKVRLLCKDAMKNEKGYCEKVTALMPQTLDEYLEQAHAFIGGSVFCNWLYKNRVVEWVRAYDIASSYPWVLVSCRYPQSIFFNAPKGKETKYMHNERYVYLIRFKARNVESNFNCHFLSRSKALSLKNCKSENGRIYRAEEIEYILTSVDFELFEKLYSYDKDTFEIISFKFARSGYLNNTFRRLVLEQYKGKTIYKGVENMTDIYQNRKENINAMYGDYVTKVFSDTITYDYENKDSIWGDVPLDEESFNKKLKSINRKRFQNYKAFIQGVFVTAWARKRIWDGIIEDETLDECLCYVDTDSMKVHNYTGDFFSRVNAKILERHKELYKELGVTEEELAPKDIHGEQHPLGVWEQEKTAKFFKSLGCKQYIVQYENGDKFLTCAGISKLAVQLFDTVDDFKIDRQLTEKELASCTDGKGHTAEKLTPYYSVDYPEVVYPDGYRCTYKSGICLMPTTFNLSITPSDMLVLYEEVLSKLNKVYYNKKI